MIYTSRPTSGLVLLVFYIALSVSTPLGITPPSISIDTTSGLAAPIGLLSTYPTNLTGLSSAANSTNNLQGNTRVDLPGFPTRFKVPNSDISVLFDFGWVRKNIDPILLAMVISKFENEVYNLIREFGPSARYPDPRIPYTDKQRLRLVARPTPMTLYIEQMEETESSAFTFGQLRDAIEGLRLYLIGGTRPYQTGFMFGPGESTIGMDILAWGSIK